MKPPLAALLLLAAVLLCPLTVAAGEPPGTTPAATTGEAATGILKVSSNVEGASIDIDYDPAGEVPLTRYVAPGPHTVRVAADGFEPFVMRVEVVADATTEVTADLFPGGGTVEFYVEPAGATVQVDGHQVGSAPIRLTDVPPGRHHYRVSAPRYEPEQGDFTFEPGENLLFTHRLASSAGRFGFASTPAGAAVWLDGRQVGVTPLEMQGVAPGVHHVRLQMDGRGTVLRRVDTSDGSRGEVRARLRENPGTLLVRAGTGDAVIEVDGDAITTGRRAKLSLSRGRYLVRVSAPGKAPAQVKARVAARGRTVVKARLAGDGHSSSARVLPPLLSRWTFWTAAGLGAAGVGAGTWALVATLQPEPPPQGDVVVVLP